MFIYIFILQSNMGIRDAFRNLSVIYNEAFCEYSLRQKVLTIFQKSSIIDV